MISPESNDDRQRPVSPTLVRTKGTDLERTVPPISELIVNQQTILDFTNLYGEPERVDYRDLADCDPFPIPMPVDREGYGTVESSRHYWASGYGDWLNVKHATEKYVDGRFDDLSHVRLLDFGCASGRFLRHVRAFGLHSVDAWGCDFSPQNVAWCLEYLPQDLKVFLNSSVPHLPFSDGFFDVVTAFSVFTHIDYFEDAWLLELRRIAQGRGIVYVTVQNEATWGCCLERKPYIERLMRANDIPGNTALSEELFRMPMPEDRLVIRMSAEDVYNCNVWLSNEYIRNRWSRYFEILDIIDRAHSNFQSVVILRPLDHETGCGYQEHGQKRIAKPR